ncbi:hypothetical protein LXA43DRAFT_996565 [Ganoderma leucocontextum]|nr:hypothetical protein LXA43DRAFT_996565 [Ganoderma leucocontextum]
MASHSSRSVPTSSTSAPSETASSTNGNGNPGMQGLSSSSSLPFSFLVTFVAIFLFFLGCGLGSRRVTRTLRQNLGLEVTGLGSTKRASRVPRERPLLWDAFPHAAPSPLGCTGDDRVFSHSWDVLAPVAATYVRTSPPGSERAPAPAAAPTPPEARTVSTTRWPLDGTGFVSSRGLMRSIPRLPPRPTPRAPPVPSRVTVASRRTAPEMRWRGHRVPDWIARLLMPDPRDGPQAWQGFDPDARSDCPTPDETSQGETEVQALQLVVLVSMPSPERARALRVRAKALEAERRESGSNGEFRAEVDVSAGKTIGEYLLGTARVPWKEGEMGGSR